MKLNGKPNRTGFKEADTRTFVYFLLLRLLHANPEAAIIFTTDVQRSNISKVFMLSLSRASAWIFIIMQLNTL